MLYRDCLLATLIVSALAPSVHASNVRGEWINRLQQMGHALETYEEVYRVLPQDIVDGTGKPNLSWRVALLPFLEEDHLYREFQLTQPWDSRANKALVANRNVRNVYANLFYLKHDQGLAGVVIPRGAGTFWGVDGRRKLKDIRGDPARTILLIEVAEDAAPVWSEPRDLIVDPANPRSGLGWHWRSGLLHERSCFAVFADGKVRRITESISDEQLRQLFSAEGADALSLNWYEAMMQTPVGRGIAPTLVISVITILGSFALIFKIARRRSISPGEILWLILGIEYLVFVAVFVAGYEYQLVSDSYRGNHTAYMALVAPARLAGCAACLFGLVWMAKAPGWSFTFTGLLVLMALASLDAATPDRNRAPEHALVTMPAPFVMALAGLVGFFLTVTKGTPDPPSNRLAHWAGILWCFVPLIWFSVWWSAGFVYPGGWFVRIRD